MSDELPQGWALTTLGEICSKPQYGWTCRAAKEGKIKYVRTTDISDGGIIDWPSVPYCEEVPEDVEKYRVTENDILVSRAGSVGVSFRIVDVPCDAVFASYLIRFKPLDGIPPKYVEFFLNSDSYWRSISEFSAGIAVPNVNASKLASLEMPLPPMAEQRRIVAKLEKLLGQVDACQQRLEKMPTLLKRFRQSILAAACSGRLTADWREENPDIESGSKRWNIEAVPITSDDLPDLPESWDCRRLDDISERVSVTYVGPTSQYYCEKSEGVLYLRSQNVRPAKLDLTGSLYISRKFHELNKKSQLKPGDLLIVRVGANRGDTCLLPEGLGDVNCGNVIVARPFAGISDFLNNYFQTPFCQASLQDLTTGSAQGVINTTVVAGVPVPIPPLAEQQEIVRRVAGLFALADQLELRLAQARGQVAKLTPSLLARAFAGKLVPQDPDDESASILLARLKQPRATFEVEDYFAQFIPALLRAAGGKLSLEKLNATVALLFLPKILKPLVASIGNAAVIAHFDRFNQPLKESGFAAMLRLLVENRIITSDPKNATLHLNEAEAPPINAVIAEDARHLVEVLNLTPTESLQPVVSKLCPKELREELMAIS